MIIETKSSLLKQSLSQLSFGDFAQRDRSNDAQQQIVIIGKAQLIKPELIQNTLLDDVHSKFSSPSPSFSLSSDFLTVWPKKTTSCSTIPSSMLFDGRLTKKSTEGEITELNNNSSNHSTLTHLTSEKLKKSEKKTFNVLTNDGDHPYCNLSKKCKSSLKRNQNKSIKKSSKKSSVKKSDNCRILFQHPTEKLTIVPIKVVNGLNCDSSKFLFLNENSDDQKSLQLINDIVNSESPTKMSTMVRDTATIQYMTDNEHQITFQPLLHHHHQKPMLEHGKIATNKNNSYENTYKKMGLPNHSNISTTSVLSNNNDHHSMLLTSLPSIQTILNDNFSSGSIIPSLHHFEENDMNSFNTSHNIQDNFMDYYSNPDIILAEDDNISNEKCLPFGYFDVDDKEYNQIIVSPLTSSNTSSPVFDSIDLLSANANINEQKKCSNNSNNDNNENYTSYNNNGMAFIFDNNTNSNLFVNNENENLTGDINDPTMFGNNNERYIKLNNDLSNKSCLFDSNVYQQKNDNYLISEENFVSTKNNTNSNSIRKSMIPMINNKKQQELTLTQLNLTFPSVKEDEGIIENWIDIGYNGSNLLECENLIEQQQHIISDRSMTAKKMSNSVPDENGLIIPSNTLNSMLDELNVEDTSLEIESYFQQQNQQQQSTVNSSQMFTTDTSNQNNSFIIQDNVNTLSRIYSSPLLQGQSNELVNDHQTSFNQFLMNNNMSSKFVNENSTQCNLVSKSSPNSLNDYQKNEINFPGLTMISSPNVLTHNNAKFHRTSNSSNMFPMNHLTLITNNRIRNNSMCTDISSHDEGFASQPEDDFDDNSDNNSEMIVSNCNNAKLIDNKIFLMNSTDQMSNMSKIQISDDNGCNMTNSTISLPLELTLSEDNKSFNPLKQEQKDNDIWMPRNKTFGQNKSSNLSPIDENEESDDDDESFYNDYDASDLIGATISGDVNNKWSLNMGRSRKGNDKRYFWQYNVQSKGPKGPRIGSGSFDDDDDPHVINKISDPVFAPDCQVEGVKHSGKARRGDGNDLTANPKKLLVIGLELKKLSKIINELTPVTELPITCRNKSRKEKNKLASRACRLKKKAQHEANKIKLHGLHREHGRLLKLIDQIRYLIDMGIQLKESNNFVYINTDVYSCKLASVSDLDSILNKIVSNNKINFEIAGNTVDFVNRILDNVTFGTSDGGLSNC